MVLKESSETVFLGQPIVIVLSAQKQIVPLRHEVSKAHFNIKAPEIKVVEPIVIKQLLPHIDQSVEGFRNPRLVKSSSSLRQSLVRQIETQRAQNCHEPGLRNITARLRAGDSSFKAVDLLHRPVHPISSSHRYVQNLQPQSLSRSQPATNARDTPVAHLLDGHLMFCSQETIGIHSAEISQIITVDPGIRERDRPIAL